TYGGDLRVTSETPWSDDDIATILSYESVASVQNLTEATPVTWETTHAEQKQFSVFAVNEAGPLLFESTGKERLYKELNKTSTVLLGTRAFDEWGGNIGEYIH